MADKTQFLTTSEFSKKAGIPVSTVSKLIRSGKIKGAKKAGKWLIGEDQLAAKAIQESAKGSKAAPVAKSPAKKPGQPKKSAKPSAQDYSIAEFSAMTYLTEFGVKHFLKEGRLKGAQDDKGDWRIEAMNLEVPGIKNLVR